MRYARLMQDAGADALELNLYHVVADPAMTAADREEADLELIAAVRVGRDDPARRQAQPVLHGDGRLRRRVPGPPARTASSCSTASTSPTSTSTASTSSPASSSATPTTCGCRCAGSRILRPQLGSEVSLAATSGVHSGDRRGEGADGRRGRRDDDLRAAAPRPGARADGRPTSWRPGWTSTSTSRSPSCAAAPAQASVEDPSAFERGNYMTALRSWATPPELVPA